MTTAADERRTATTTAATGGGGGGRAACRRDPQVPGTWLQCGYCVLAGLVIFAYWQRRRRRRRQRAALMTTTTMRTRVACCRRAGRRRAWRRAEFASIIDAVSRGGKMEMCDGVLLVVKRGRATPALGAVKARGRMWPPIGTAPDAFGLRAVLIGARNGELGKCPSAYTHHGNKKINAWSGSAVDERRTTARSRRRAAIKPGRGHLWLKPWILCWLKLIVLAGILSKAGEQGWPVSRCGQYNRRAYGAGWNLGCGEQRDAERDVPSRTGGIRFGEAQHPGPRSEQDIGRALTVTTGNGTGWGTISAWLGDHKGEVLCVQEHKLLHGDDVEAERKRVLDRGWKSAWSPATPSGTAANEASGGAAIFVKNHIGVDVPHGGEDVYPGQVAATMIEMASLGWMVVYSVYGRCGDEMTNRNWEMCQALTNHALGHGLPWIAGGDWNLEPPTLRASGWLAKMRATILTANVDATTHAGRRRGRHIDFFVASQSIAAVGPRLSLCADAVIRTHDAISLTMPVAPRQFTIRRLVRAKVFPRELPIGPRRMVDTPADIRSSARAALALGNGGDREAAVIMINEATREILRHLEEVLIEAYMIDDERRDSYVGRANGVTYAQGPLLGPKIGKYGAAAPTVRRLRALQDRAAALAAAAARRMQKAEATTEGGGGGAAAWTDLIERAKAAIHTGHHVAAVERKKRGETAADCHDWACELKAIGRWTERWATWAANRTRGSGGGDLCHQYQVLHDGDGGGGHSDWVAEVAALCQRVAEQVAAAAERAEAAERSERQAAVRKWATEASHAGAAMAHRWTKVPQGWRPETIEAEINGSRVVTADPGAVVEQERAKWEALWRPSAPAQAKPRWGRTVPLSRPTVEQFRRAARKFPRRTGIGVEGILPADFDALDDEGITVCIEIMLACEAIGHIPDVIALILVRLIPKRDGGRRPIGLLPSLYRIWAKVRAGAVRDWERQWARDYFAAGPGKSAEAAAWASALRAEIARSANASSASVLWDLLKCFEHGQHFLLAEEAEAVDFPIALARMSSEMYMAERRLVLDEAVSQAVHPSRGFMAGCARALALIKVLMVRRMDAYVARHPRVVLDWYVDDVELQAVGTRRVVQTIKNAVADLRNVLVDQLGFALAEDKARVVASADDIAEEIVQVTDGTAGRAVARAAKLGVELTSGRRAGRVGGIKRDRMRKALARQRRLLKFRAMGGSANKVVRRGVIPSTAFGSTVSGVSDAELAKIRRLVARTSAPGTKGASAALKLLLDGDPGYSANAATLYRWAEAAWDTAAPAAYCKIGADSVVGAVRAQHEEDNPAAGAFGARRCATTDEGKRRFRAGQLDAAIEYAIKDAASGSWEGVRGPASAAYLTARRIGWTFRSGTVVADELGRDIDMARTAPSCVRKAVIRATRACSAAAAAARWGRAEFTRGIWHKPVQTAAGRLRPAARAALRRVWAGGYWSRARLADVGLADSAECDKCSAARDDAYHRIWECEHGDMKSKREAATTPQMRAEAARAGRDDMRFTRGLLPSPWSRCAPPRSDYEEIHVDGDLRELSEPLVVDRPVFIDGSALWPNDPEARRAGWAIVMVDNDGKLTGAIYGHLPWAESGEQTAGHAEMYALRRAAELAVGDLRVLTDYREAAEGIHKGEAATTSPGMKHAAHWRAFWRAVDGSSPSVEKVKGHVTEAEAGHDADRRWRRAGNNLADRMAKKGARAHYIGDQWAEAKSVARQQEDHADLCSWIGDSLAEWADEKRVRRKQADRRAMLERRRQRREAARAVGGHRVSWGRDGWKCQDCGMQARTPSGARRLTGQPCPGHIVTRIPDQGGGGAAAHVLWTAEAEGGHGQGGANVTWCSVCGAYSSTRLYKLAGRCGGPAEKAALSRLKALRGLRHPVLGYRLARPHRMTDDLKRIMTTQAAGRRARYAEAMKAGGGSEAASEEACRDGNGASDEAAAAAHRDRGPEDDCRMGDPEASEEDVFGYGGGLEAEDDRERDASDYGTSNVAAPRVVPLGPSADSENPRAVPTRLAAGQCKYPGSSGDGDLVAVGVQGTSGDADGMQVTDDDLQMEPVASTEEGPTGQGEGDADGRGCGDPPTSNAAFRRVRRGGCSDGSKRGTRVFEWAHQYGVWRWVPASERCGGVHCICDLSLDMEDIKRLRNEHGLATAAQVQAAEASVVMARHQRRWAEQAAMAEEDADAAKGPSGRRDAAAAQMTTGAARDAAKRARRVADRRTTRGADESGNVGPGGRADPGRDDGGGDSGQKEPASGASGAARGADGGGQVGARGLRGPADIGGRPDGAERLVKRGRWARPQPEAPADLGARDHHGSQRVAFAADAGTIPRKRKRSVGGDRGAQAGSGQAGESGDELKCYSNRRELLQALIENARRHR